MNAHDVPVAMLALSFCLGGNVHAAVSDEPELTLWNTQPKRVLCLDHSGPYWTLGEQFSKLRSYMQQHDIEGALYARYLQTPNEDSTSWTRAQLGVILEGSHHPLPPYRVDTLPAEHVAEFTAVGAFHSPARHFAWAAPRIRRLGYEPAMPLTEMFPVDGEDNRAMIRIAVKPLARKSPTETGRQKPAVDTVITPAKRAAAQVEEERQPPADGQRPNSFESEARPPVSSRGDTTGRADVDQTVPPTWKDQTESATQSKPDGLDTIDYLVQAVLPRRMVGDPVMRDWMHDVVYRVEALHRGARRLEGPSVDPRLGVLSDKLVHRLKELAPDVVAGGSDRHTNLDGSYRQVVNRLERVMVDLATGRIKGEKLYLAVLSALESARDAALERGESAARR